MRQAQRCAAWGARLASRRLAPRASPGSGTLLYRVIFSHLLVAVPPAAALGLLVLDINHDALKTEAQQLHLSVANRLKEALEAEVKSKLAVLGEAERVLDMTEVELEKRQLLLRAMVADGRVPHLAIYRADGAFDGLVRAKDVGAPDRTPLSQALLRELTDRGWALGDAKDGSALLAIAWKREGTPLGYLATTQRLADFDTLATELSTRYLGPGGEVDVVDGEGRYLISSVPGRAGHVAGTGTPFETYAGGKLRQGLSAIEAGAAMSFTAPDGLRRLGAVVSAPDLRWIVGTSRSEAVAFASLERVRLRVVLMSLVAALGAGFVGLLLARQVSEPIRALIRAVRASAKSGFTQGVAVEARGEVAVLAGTFNEALRELAAHRTEVQRKTQLRLRLARFLPPALLHQIFSNERDLQAMGQEQHVTVIYSDVSGAKELGAHLAGEQLVAILGEFFAAACSAVERNGGRIDRFSGDAVIGIFAPGMATDPTTAALAAARETIADAAAISTRWSHDSGVGFAAAVGVVSGRGLIGLAPDGSGEVSVVGDLVDRAAALQEAALPATILADRATREAVRDPQPWTAVAPRVRTLGTDSLFQLAITAEQTAG